MAQHQAKILFGGFSSPDRGLQAGEACPRPGKNQDPAGVAIQPMHQLEMILRAGCAQQFNRTMTDPAAAVAGDARRLVDHQKVLVLENDRLGNLRHQVGPGTGVLDPFGHAYGRNAQHVTRRQARVGLGALAVDPHLAGSQKTVNHAFGDPLEHGHQGIVDTLSVALRTHLNLTYAMRSIGGRCRLH